MPLACRVPCHSAWRCRRWRWSRCRRCSASTRRPARVPCRSRRSSVLAGRGPPVSAAVGGRSRAAGAAGRSDRSRSARRDAARSVSPSPSRSGAEHRARGCGRRAGGRCRLRGVAVAAGGYDGERERAGGAVVTVDDDEVRLARGHVHREARAVIRARLAGAAAGDVVVAGELGTAAGAAPHIEHGVVERGAAAGADGGASGDGRRPLEDALGPLPVSPQVPLSSIGAGGGAVQGAALGGNHDRVVTASRRRGHGRHRRRRAARRRRRGDRGCRADRHGRRDAEREWRRPRRCSRRRR